MLRLLRNLKKVVISERRNSYMAWEEKYYEMEYQRDLTIGRIGTINSLIHEGANWDLIRFCLENIKSSNSQMCQDLIAAYIFESSGELSKYFVEFGAADGINLSNTAFLDGRGWTGILCEPSLSAFAKLEVNRKKTKNFQICVFGVSGQMVTFVETENSLLSTIEEFIGSDDHHNSRVAIEKYLVPTLTLEDLLESCEAPAKMSLLSIDTEGTEYQILEKFDFERFQFQLIFVEHNYGPNSKAILDLILKNNYELIFEKTSRHDYWFIHKDLSKQIKDKLKPS